MLMYIAIIVFGLYKLSLWDTSLFKTTILWTLGGAFVLFFNVDKALEDKKKIWQIFKGCFSLTIIIEFLSNLYAFNLTIELISIPILIFIGAAMALPQENKEYKIVKSFFGFLYVSYIIAVIIFSIINISENFSTIVSIENLKSLIFSSIMTILFIPFLYLVALFMSYENFFTMKKYILREKPELYKYLRGKIISACKLKLNKINKINKKLYVYTTIEKKQIENEINAILK